MGGAAGGGARGLSYCKHFHPPLPPSFPKEGSAAEKLVTQGENNTGHTRRAPLGPPRLSLASCPSLSHADCRVVGSEQRLWRCRGGCSAKFNSRVPSYIQCMTPAEVNILHPYTDFPTAPWAPSCSFSNFFSTSSLLLMLLSTLNFTWLEEAAGSNPECCV